MTNPIESMFGNSERFMREHWPERHAVFHGSLDRLPEAFQSPLLLDPVELAKAYRGEFFVTHKGSTGQHGVTSGDARAYFEDLGVSVRFEHMERYLPGAPELLRDLEAALGLPRGAILMGAFVNARGSGLVPHCDHHEGFLVHIRGTKVFRVMPHPTVRFAHMMHSGGRPVPPEWIGQSASGGLPAHAELPSDASEEIRLRSGSVLFMPRGLYHQTTAEDDVSVSVTLVARTPCAATLLTRNLTSFLLQAESMRTPLYGAYGADPVARESARVRLERLIDEAAEQVARLRASELLAAANAGPLEVSDVYPESRFQRDINVGLTVTGQESERIVVETVVGARAAERLAKRLPNEARAVVEWMRDGRAAFSFADLVARFPEWDEKSLAAIVVFLVRGSALVHLPFPAYGPR